MIWMIVLGVVSFFLVNELNTIREKGIAERKAWYQKRQYEDTIEGKIANLKKQAEDREIYEKALKILSSYNKGKNVRTYTLYFPGIDDAFALAQQEEMKETGIVTYRGKNIIISKDKMLLSIISTEENKTVFLWGGGWHTNSDFKTSYTGPQVSGYIPGEWEKELNKMFIEVQEEEKLQELNDKQQREKETLAGWGF